MVMKGLLPEGRYAQCANGYRIHYLDVGPVAGDPAAAPVVVFLHGFRPRRQWLQQFQG
jgi:4,5:9,10-diseco-3-hydroxy-5,9,17-trioxoandrosta-1(10),2-diene-4-oate hydrolase